VLGLAHQPYLPAFPVTSHAPDTSGRSLHSSPACLPNSFTLASPSTITTTTGHRRRRSSTAKIPTALDLQDSSYSRGRIGTTSGIAGIAGGAPGEQLAAIPGTPADFNMSSRSPSPHRSGGWSSPGLNTPYDTGGGRSSPYPNGGTHNVTWASAQARSSEVKGYAAFNPRNTGFFGKHFRRISSSLPFSYAEREKLGRGRYSKSQWAQYLTHIGRILWRLRLKVGILLLFAFAMILYYVTRKSFSPPFFTTRF
jgi:mannan polymerase II complex MNN10 subunit